MNATRPTRGFTIVELLVVIGIILILAAILIPAVRSAMGAARDARCVANMKAWSFFLAAYAAPHHGDLPPIVAPGDSLYAPSQTLKDYFAQNDLDPRVAYCPANGSLYATVSSDRWGELRWTEQIPNFTTPLVLVNNNMSTTPSAGPVPTVTVDNLTTGADTYFAISGSADRSVVSDEPGYYDSNFVRIAAASTATTYLIVDNADTADPNNHFQVTGTAAATESSESPIYNADYVRIECSLPGISDIIVDNLTTGTNYFEVTNSPTTTWSNVSTYVAGYNATNYRWIKCVASPATPTYTGKWHFTVPTPTGATAHVTALDLSIEVTWPKGTASGRYSSGYCITDAPFRVVHRDGTSSYAVNQQPQGSTTSPTPNFWYSLGTHTYVCGESYTVEVDNVSSNTLVAGGVENIYADAVRVKSVSSSATTATWYFKVPDPDGTAATVTAPVDIKFPKSTTNAVTDAQFKVYYEGGSQTVTVNQQTTDTTSTWYNLGSFSFKRGSSYRVELSNSSAAYGSPAGTNKNVYADAIRLSFPSATPTIASWNFKVPIPSGGTSGQSVSLDVSAQWPKSAANCISDATFTIYYEGGNNPFVVNQQTVGSDWHKFGTFSFKTGSAYRVELTNSSAQLGVPGVGNTNIHADAVRITDPTAGSGDGLPAAGTFAVVTTGWNSTGTQTTNYPPSTPRDYLWSSRTTTGTPNAAVWVFVAPSGSQTLYGWWPNLSTGCANVPFYIYRRSDNLLVKSATVSQSTGGTWLAITTCTFTAGEQYYVKVSSAAGSGTYVFADAIAIPGTPTSVLHSFPCLGYLYLGYRDGLPTGSPAPSSPAQLISNITDSSSPSQTPILVDWMSDIPTFTPHGNTGHELMLDGSVRTIQLKDAVHHWTNADGVKFYW